MHRMKDFYQRQVQERSKTEYMMLNDDDFETYEEWLKRNYLSEEQDDLGFYGTETTSWENHLPVLKSK